MSHSRSAGHLAAAHRVEVVKDQAHRIVELRERVAESRERAGAASGHGEARELRTRPRQRGEYLEPERPPVRVLGGEGDVRDRLGVGRRGHPSAQQDGLAGARGSRDERERALDAGLDEAEQSADALREAPNRRHVRIQTFARVPSHGPTR